MECASSTASGFTTVDPKKTKLIQKKAQEKLKKAKEAKEAKAESVQKKELPAKEAPIKVAPAPAHNAWAKPLIKKADEAASAVTDEAATAATDEAATAATDEAATAATDQDDGEWEVVGKKAKKEPKAPQYFIGIERGFGLKITYRENGKPFIVQMSEKKSKDIGWIPEMRKLGFYHMRTPEGHHIFYQNKRLKLTLMMQCLDYTIKNSTKDEDVARAREVMGWKKVYCEEFRWRFGVGTVVQERPHKRKMSLHLRLPLMGGWRVPEPE